VQRALERAPSGSIAVTSPGGGTGCTTVALHLAHALARMGPTCFVDLDVGRGAATRLGFDQTSVRTWADLDDDPGSVLLSALPVPGGFRALIAPGGAAAIDADTVVSRASSQFQRLVIDAPIDGFDAVTERVDGAVLVMSPTVVQARRARVLLDARSDVSWAIVTNRLGPGGETTRAELQEILGRRIALELPCSAALRDAEGEGRLLTAPWHRWRRALERLARALASS
jgi:Flp pilus assembly CpaE family ATPase